MRATGVTGFEDALDMPLLGDDVLGRVDARPQRVGPAAIGSLMAKVSDPQGGSVR